MAIAVDCLGLARVGDGLIPADTSSEKAAAARRAGALAVRSPRRHDAARASSTAARSLNAMAGIAVASGGSTNGVLHLLAIAREAGVPLTPRRARRRRAGTPVLASLVPGGRFVAEDLHAAGGTAT